MIRKRHLPTLRVVDTSRPRRCVHGIALTRACEFCAHRLAHGRSLRDRIEVK